MDGVVSRVFLILESRLRNDGKRKAKAGGESSGAKMGTSLAPTSLPHPPASAGAEVPRSAGPHGKSPEWWAQRWWGATLRQARGVGWAHRLRRGRQGPAWPSPKG